MALLIITTILWAFSFSFYGEYLAGHVDSYFAVLVRVGLAALVFLPFLRTRGNSLKTVGLYMLVGAMQLAIGMVGYKRLMETRPMPQHNAFAWFYLGAFLVAVIAWFLLGNAQKMPQTTLQWGILVFLGVVASGIGYFMWNYGATQVDAGTLGIMNNMHVPAGLLVNLAIWHQQPHWPTFITGALVILASLWVHRKWVAPRSSQTADDRRRDCALSE